MYQLVHIWQLGHASSIKTVKSLCLILFLRSAVSSFSQYFKEIFSKYSKGAASYYKNSLSPQGVGVVNTGLLPSRKSHQKYSSVYLRQTSRK